MPSERPQPSARVEGRILREQPECQPGELKLAAHVFDKAGALLGSAELDEKGSYAVALRLARPSDVELVVGPVGDPQQLRRSSAFSTRISASEWKLEGGQLRVSKNALLPVDVWLPWWPKRICVSGHVRKESKNNGVTSYCPVPFVKVELFDVDRESCWWPWLYKWLDVLSNRPVIRIPELLKPVRSVRKPIPRPDPPPELSLDPQPLPPRFSASRFARSIGNVALDPEPEVADVATALSGGMRVGEVAQLSSAVAARLERVTLTSKIAPWIIRPRCFYSKVEVCETTTDCNGYFKCCFDWWPFHFRRGRLRYDARPDIIVKVTQVINGVETVVYMDPYSSTRWDVYNTHIDLALDNEEVVCGNGQCYEPPAGSPVFFTRIGNDEVYQIHQTTGLYNDATYTNVAYGSTLSVHGQFGDALTRSDPGEGGPTPHFYYRLSYAKQGSSDADFKFIAADLTDIRVGKGSLIGESHKLGPYTVNDVPSLYEVRNFDDYYWYNPDWIGIWSSSLAEEDTGTYVLRLELFDRNGIRLSGTSGLVSYLNGAGTGTGVAPAPLLPMGDHCDLVITLDNKPPVVELVVPSVINACGVIPWSAVPPLDFSVNASQENNRLHGWALRYTKGVGSEQLLASSPPTNNGLPGSFTNHVVSGASLLVGLDTTCAFALRLGATAHIRNGYSWVYYAEDIDAIAIENCKPCPKCP